MPKKIIESVQEEPDAKLYEFSFHLVPKMSAEDAVSAFTDIKNQITAAGATIKNESTPTLLNLAYQMEITVDSVKQKYTQAHFAWIIFEATGPQIEEFNAEFKLRTDIVRHLLITTKNESPLTAAEVAEMVNPKAEQSEEDFVENVEEEEVTSKTEEEKPSEEEQKKDEAVDEAIDKLVE